MNWRDTQTQERRERIIDALGLIAATFFLIVALLTGPML